MATATQETKKAKTEPQTHTFYSRSRKFRLPRVKGRQDRDSYGEAGARVYFQDDKGRDISRVVYEFQNGTLTAVDGEDNFPDGPNGEWQDKVQWLRRHEEFNKRFHEHGNEPDRPLPTDEDFMDMVNEASLALDVDRIVELLRTERETHNRASLVSFADRTRKRTLKLRQEIEAERKAGDAA